MSDETLEFNYEVEDLIFCDCCHCQEAEEGYYRDLERGYQIDLLLEPEVSTAD